MKHTKPKNLLLAIGLNLVLPGAGYLYMGRLLIGIIGGALVISMLYYAAVQDALIVWLGANAIMAIDMAILSAKRNKALEEASTKKCSACAEVIKAEATKCRFCGERAI